MTETVRIEALGHAGDGIAETSAGRRFVPYTLPGEIATIALDGNRARLIAVETPSPDRVTPPCRHFGVCGGCALQHMARPAYLAWKHAAVVTTLAQAGIDVPVDAVVPVPSGSRRRAVLSAVRTARGVVLGFQRRGSNDIVAVEECPVLASAIVSRLGLLREIAAIVGRPKRSVRLAVLAADNGLDIAVTGGGSSDRRTMAALGGFGAEADIARLTLDGQTVFLNRRPELDVGGAALMPVAGGFVQAVAAAESTLADIVLDHVGAAAPVLDLFAGCGTFALRLARRAPVTAVEGDAALLAALDEAARHATGLKAIALRRRDLFRNPVSPPELEGYAAVVIDPPAAGAKAQCEALAASRVPMVAAISCNPATFARDARILIDGGYRLERVTPVDQFLYTAELELAATFSRT